MRNLSALIAALFLAVSAWAAPTVYAGKYALFARGRLGEYAKGYDKIVKKLKPGDTIVFSDGVKLVVQGFLGKGETTRIFSIGGGKAVRLPISSKNLLQPLGRRKATMEEYAARFMADYVVDQLELNATGVPSVAVYLKESLLPERVIVEERVPEFLLSELLSSEYRARHGITDAAFQSALLGLEDFIRKTWRFSRLGNFHAGQLGHDENGWYVLDSGGGNRPASTFADTFHTLLPGLTDYADEDPRNAIPKENKRRIAAALEDERARQAASHSDWFERANTTFGAYLFKGLSEDNPPPGTLLTTSDGTQVEVIGTRAANQDLVILSVRLKGGFTTLLTVKRKTDYFAADMQGRLRRLKDFREAGLKHTKALDSGLDYILWKPSEGETLTQFLGRLNARDSLESSAQGRALRKFVRRLARGKTEILPRDTGALLWDGEDWRLSDSTQTVITEAVVTSEDVLKMIRRDWLKGVRSCLKKEILGYLGGEGK